MKLRQSSNSVERQTSLALRRLTLWRLATAFFSFWEDAWQGLSRLPLAVASAAAECSKATYSLEQEHARRYFALTQLDPARADGDDDRYREIRIAAGVEEREETNEDFLGGSLDD